MLQIPQLWHAETEWLPPWWPWKIHILNDQGVQRNIAAKFQEKRDFPGVIGAIDATHIQIQPPHEHPQTYMNRKSYHSIILQVVCLPYTTFSNCLSGWPGSVHDSRILKNSILWAEGQIVWLGMVLIHLKTGYWHHIETMATSTLRKNVTTSFILQQEQWLNALLGFWKDDSVDFISSKLKTCKHLAIFLFLAVFFIIYASTKGDYEQEFLEDVQENINVINVRDNDDTGGAKRDRIARSLR